MFDLNLLAKPGLQGENNNDKVSFIEDRSKTLNKTDKQFQSKKDARNKLFPNKENQVGITGILCA